MSSAHPSPAPDRRPSLFDSLDGNDLLLNAPIGIFASTPAGRFIAANPALVKMYGYRSAEELIDAITDIATQLYVDPADRQFFMQLIAERGEITNHECRFRRRDGTVFWASRTARAVRDSAGKITHYQGFTNDITEQKQAEAALAQHRAELQAIYDHALVMICVLDDQRRVLYANPAFTAFTGATEEKLRNGIACGVFGCINATSSPAGCGHGRACANCTLLRALEETLHSGAAHHNIETRFTLRRGEHQEDFTLLGSTARIRGGERDTLLLSLIDISDRVALEEQLRQAQKMDSIGRLAGGVAHDYNNMLGVILGYSEMVLEQVPEGQPIHAALCGIQQAAERSADLTRQLLAFARKQTVVPKVLELNRALESTLTMLRRLIGEEIELVFEPGENLGQVKIDPGQLDQILTNLFVNARDAIGSRAAGRVMVKTDQVLCTEEDIAGEGDALAGEYVRLAVIDNGCGMDAETLAHLFEPFFTTKEMGRGTGLGLATVYGIIKQNKGFVKVASTPGRGTTVAIYLPRHRSEGTPQPQAAKEQTTETSRTTILLVEDEPMILQMAAMILQRQGYQVLTASGPREAIRLAGQFPGEIDLLITDVMMPEMNGHDLAQQLLSSYPRLKRLYMSGYTADVIAERGLLGETVDFIQKPFSIQKLTAKIQAILRGDSP
jgi:two-component system, cell cycle sensor histidine kinase and response regulator CckA